VPPNIIALRSVSKVFSVKSGLLLRETAKVLAVDKVNISLSQEKSVGLVGESGSGKSTLARMIMGIAQVSDGSVVYRGKALPTLSRSQTRTYRADVQMIFQDPYSSLNPKRSIGSTLLDPLRVQSIPRTERRSRILSMLEQVGLPPSAAGRYPHEFSGGQRQRLAIARAMIISPKLLVADEPVSALDVSIQGQILNLLLSLKEHHKMGMLFIAHNLGVVRYMAEVTCVMYLGRIVEQGPTSELFENPRHPYTRALVAAAPVMGAGKKKNRSLLKGEVPSPLNPPTGCVFHPRCPRAKPECQRKRPELVASANRKWACHYPL
jgi:oligopeptide/dipeptide ABC transporter ATP-binding protein